MQCTRAGGRLWGEMGGMGGMGRGEGGGFGRDGLDGRRAQRRLAVQCAKVGLSISGAEQPSGVGKGLGMGFGQRQGRR